MSAGLRLFNGRKEKYPHKPNGICGLFSAVAAQMAWRHANIGCILGEKQSKNESGLATANNLTVAPEAMDCWHDWPDAQGQMSFASLARISLDPVSCRTSRLGIKVGSSPTDAGMVKPGATV
ncbi:unnamed protein product [Protopolystoma xenopodis]|uniref:Uncharacterized protein n=1 Tax=Protopolystoma xenopodis TaxID=117903 RepID=A0A448WV48_9PLAT|nr:unnamed protein product [Protopolystoma xenopodis]